MNLTVFGATGGTGQEVVKRALAHGHTVTAFVRDRERLPIKDSYLQIIIGDALDWQSVSNAVTGQDAVVVTLGSRGRGKRDVRARGTANVIEAMKVQDVRRLVVVSAAGTGDSYRQLPFFLKILVKTLLRNTYADHEQQEAYVQDSELDWVIVRPAMLRDGPATGEYHTGTADDDLPGGEVSRADLADFVLQQLEDDRYLHQAITVA
jgi:putative NADH-flavin reductase